MFLCLWDFYWFRKAVKSPFTPWVCSSRTKAGIHTCVLVSIGSCLFVFVSASIDNDNSPSRVAAQVVTGIGFLGSGITPWGRLKSDELIKDNNQIKGLNTAATIWCCGAIGCLCGCGLWLTGMCCGVFISILNYTLRDSLIKRVLGKFITEEPKENVI